jgi:hypothetical protein
VEAGVSETDTLERIELDLNLDEPVECQYWALAPDMGECNKPATWTSIMRPCGHSFSVCEVHHKVVIGKWVSWKQPGSKIRAMCEAGEPHEVESVTWVQL